MEKNEKNGVFSRVRSRWRSIFSKKNNPVKLRDGNRMSFERCILSDPENSQVLGTILAEATVEPISLPNGQGIALIQETTTVYDTKNLIDQKLSCPTTSKNSRRFYRLSSGDLNLIRRMTEEIDVRCLNVIFDDNEITGEIDAENGVERACFKPGPSHPADHQMIFLKQCLTNILSRPPNMYYLTQGWTVANFEGLFKYMLKTEDCERPSFLRVEFKDCIPSLTYLNKFVGEYGALKGYRVKADFVYATVHCKQMTREKTLRGHVESFLPIEDKVRRTRVSYLSNFIINSPSSPNVTVGVRFFCIKSCRKQRETNEIGISVQLDQMIGQRYGMNADQPDLDKISCECEMEDEEDDLVQLSFENAFVDGVDETGENPSDKNGADSDGYANMFPLLLNLFDRAGMEDETSMENSVSTSSFEKSQYFELENSSRSLSLPDQSNVYPVTSSSDDEQSKPEIVEVTHSSLSVMLSANQPSSSGTSNSANGE